MPLSLKTMLKKFAHKGQITQEEYDALIKKLEGHDKEIRNKAIDEFAEKIRDWQKEVYKNDRYVGELDFLFKHIYEIAEQLKEEY